mgnify:CR=1 FL=1
MAVTLGSKSVGSIVKLRENGVLQNYLVVHQGLPSGSYDASCNGTWLLRQDCIESRVWDARNSNVYESSDIHSWLNSTMLAKYDASIRTAIKQVKIPYRKNGGYGGSDQTGANGLSCKVFLLSGREVGFTSNESSYFPNDGTKLAYFESGNGSSAQQRRIAKLNGSAAHWWSRSPHANDGHYAWLFRSNGKYSQSDSVYPFGIRPALVLPTTLFVSDDSSITTNTAPTTPPSISVPQAIRGGDTITVSWGAASDAQGNLEGYILERSTNGGSSWSQIYQGSALSTTNTVQFGTYSVMYRVKAYDSEGLQSGYKTSSQVTVINNTAPTAPGSITVPETVLAGGTVSISWTAATDSQGDALTYQLERSINGGSTWAKIYDGGQLAYTDTINQSWTTVRYRVRAYDVYTAYSPYTTSDQRTVYQLRVSSLTVPALAMEGQSIPVTWTAVPVADNYQLDRKASSDADWVTVYTGPALQHTEPVGAWTTAQFRVRAAMGGSWGEFTVSKTVPVVSAAAMVISGEDSDLGTLTADVTYTVSSNTGNPITVERRVNGLLVATVQVQSGFAYTIPVVDLPTGAGTIQIRATVNTSADAPVTATRTWSYNKQTIDIPATGAVAAVERDGRTIFPPTLAECIRVPTVWGGSMDKALELLLPILGAAVTAVGSYVGTGTYGSESPNTLTLTREPEVVTISGNGRTLTISNTVKTEGGTVGYIEGTKVTWYNGQSAEAQLNQEGVTYTYTAISKGGLPA